MSNGSTDNFSGSGSNYTVDVTPASDGLVTVDIPEDAEKVEIYLKNDPFWNSYKTQ